MRRKKTMWLIARLQTDESDNPSLQKLRELLQGMDGVYKFYFEKYLPYPWDISQELSDIREEILKMKWTLSAMQRKINCACENAKSANEGVLHLISREYLAFPNSGNEPSFENKIKSIQKIRQAILEGDAEHEDLRKTIQSKELWVIDKYLLKPPSDKLDKTKPSGKLNVKLYADELAKWLDLSEGKKVYIICEVQGAQKKILEILLERAKEKAAELYVLDVKGKDYPWVHDRLWIDRINKTAFSMGTSLNGLWKHLTAICPLNEGDVENLIRELFENQKIQDHVEKCEDYLTKL